MYTLSTCKTETTHTGVASSWHKLILLRIRKILIVAELIRVSEYEPSFIYLYIHDCYLPCAMAGAIAHTVEILVQKRHWKSVLCIWHYRLVYLMARAGNPRRPCYWLSCGLRLRSVGNVKNYYRYFISDVRTSIF